MVFRTFSGTKNQRDHPRDCQLPRTCRGKTAYATATALREHHCDSCDTASLLRATHIALMHQRALLLSLTASSAAAFVTPASMTIGTPSHALTRRWADDLDGAGADDAAAAPSLDAVETAVLNDALDTAAKQTAPRKKKKRPVDPERAATKFVKTATNPVTWKNGIYAGSLAVAVLLPVALLALAQK